LKLLKCSGSREETRIPNTSINVSITPEHVSQVYQNGKHTLQVMPSLMLDYIHQFSERWMNGMKTDLNYKIGYSGKLF